MRAAIVLASVLVAHTSVAAPSDDEGAIHDSAETPGKEQELGERYQIPIIIAENAIVLAIPTLYYYHTAADQLEDWELPWTWDAWREKLFTRHGLVFDTNRFYSNGILHPLTGALLYQIGRANDLSAPASLAASLADTLIWEYVVEYREHPSINDIMANTLGTVLAGEALYQIGLVGDDASPLRRALGFATSPFHRAQREVGLSPHTKKRLAARLELIAGTEGVQYGDLEPVQEARIGLDLEVMRNKVTEMGGWSRVAVDLRLGGATDGVSGGTFHSFTTYGGRVTRDVDENENGQTRFYGIGGGMDLSVRRLPWTQDRYSIFHAIQPTFASWWRKPYGELHVQTGVSADLAMIHSMARAGLPFDEMSSVMRARGYYYATGGSVFARAQARTGIWHGGLEGRAHQLYSFDNHTYRGIDPRDVTDTRLVSTATLGVQPFSNNISIDAFGSAIWRGGTAEDMERHETELEAGMALRLPF